MTALAIIVATGVVIVATVKVVNRLDAVIARDFADADAAAREADQ